MVARVLFAAFVALIFTVLLPSDNAPAASFDCATATQPVEKLICSDAELSKLDEEMARAYSDAIARLSSADAPALKSNQRAWLKTRRAKCKADAPDARACLQA